MAKFVDYQKTRTFMVGVGSDAQGVGNEIFVDIPKNSIVTVKAAVAVPFNGIEPTLDVTDTSGGSYINGADLATVGMKGGGDGFLSTDGSVKIAVSGSGSTTGTAFVSVTYINEELSDGTWSNEG